MTTIRQPDCFTLDKQNFKLLNHVNSFQNIIHGAAIVLVYTSLSIAGTFLGRWYIWIPIWFYQGFILSGFLGGSHDCAHGTFVKNKSANRIFGILWSSAVLFNFSLYKYYHLNHHRYTHVPGDTEPYGSFRNMRDYLCTLPMTGFFLPFWKMSALAPFNWFPTFIKTKVHQVHVKQDNWGLLTWIILIVTLTYFYPLSLIEYYWIPILIYFPMVFFTSIPEHYDCEEGKDITKNTRTLESNLVFKYIFWNGNYHAEHHLFPSIPSHNLSKLNKLIGHEFAVREKSYLSFHIKMIKGILKRKRDSSNLIFEPQERVVYKFYKAQNQ